MKYFRIINVLTFLFFAVVLAIATNTFAQQKVITLRYAHPMPAGDPSTVLSDEWGKEVEKRTNGRIKILFYPGATLSSPPATYENISKGVIDIGDHVLMYTPGRFPLMSLLYDYPIDYPDLASPMKIANEFYRHFRPKELDDVKVLFLHSMVPAILISRKPVTTLEDLKGMKVRTSGENAKIMEQFGAIPVGLPVMECYDAASKGMIDGITTGITAMESFRFAEVMKYVIEYTGSAQTVVVLTAMNKNKWNAIPSDLQKIIEDVSKEWPDKFTKVNELQSKTARDYSISKGVKITKLSAEENAKWKAKSTSSLNEYISKMKQKGLPGEEALKFVQDALKKVR